MQASFLKRKRDFTQPPKATIGELGQLLSQVNTAVDYLKTKRQPNAATAILGYLSLQHANKDLRNRLLHELRKRPDVIYNADHSTYAYKPKIPVANADELRAYLQSRPSSVGIRYDELRDGWPDCQQTLDELEKAHDIIMIRDRKSIIKLMWNDEPSLHTEVSHDLQHQWLNVKLPLNPDDLRERLELAGLKPTSAPKATVKKSANTEKKKRTIKRANNRQTNAHIVHLLKDYSHKKK